MPRVMYMMGPRDIEVSATPDGGVILDLAKRVRQMHKSVAVIGVLSMGSVIAVTFLVEMEMWLRGMTAAVALLTLGMWILLARASRPTGPVLLMVDRNRRVVNSAATELSGSVLEGLVIRTTRVWTPSGSSATEYDMLVIGARTHDHQPTWLVCFRKEGAGGLRARLSQMAASIGLPLEEVRDDAPAARDSEVVRSTVYGRE